MLLRRPPLRTVHPTLVESPDRPLSSFWREALSFFLPFSLLIHGKSPRCFPIFAFVKSLLFLVSLFVNFSPAARPPSPLVMLAFIKRQLLSQ